MQLSAPGWRRSPASGRPGPSCFTQPLAARPIWPPWPTARGLGKTLAYPVCGENFSLTAAVPGEDGWEAGAYGIRAPILSRAEILPPEALDLILVPCTAFDAACGRVGMGKGYYDRYLPRCTRAVKLGIAFEAQRVPHAALDEHDQRLDAFITEGGIYRGTDKIEL